MKKSVKIIIILSLILILLLTGYFLGKYYIVNYMFNKGIDGIISASQNAAVPSPGEPSVPELTPSPQEPETSVSHNPQSSVTEEIPVDSMTEREVILQVMKDSALISKMSNMVSYSDRQKIISIIISNFTSQEISHYAAKASTGLDSATKSELMSIARSRLTSAQISECMQIAYKYADQIRPYLKKN